MNEVEIEEWKRKGTSGIREEFDEPSVKANAIGRREPDVFVGESETRRIDGVGFSETR